MYCSILRSTVRTFPAAPVSASTGTSSQAAAPTPLRWNYYTGQLEAVRCSAVQYWCPWRGCSAHGSAVWLRSNLCGAVLPFSTDGIGDLTALLVVAQYSSVRTRLGSTVSTNALRDSAALLTAVRYSSVRIYTAQYRSEPVISVRLLSSVTWLLK